MNPPPQCKTAIISFIVDKIPKLWNVSSNTRKRMEMIIGDRDIIVSEYSPKALIINGWVRIGRRRQGIENIEDIKKGVSNYKLTSQEQLDKVVSLNGKLRCSEINFIPQKPFDCESIDEIVANKEAKFNLYEKCTFGRIKNLYFYSFTEENMKKILAKVKKIDFLFLNGTNFSAVDLTSHKIKEVALYSNAVLVKNISLPDSLKGLHINDCKFDSIKNTERITELKLISEETDTTYYSWISGFKSLKIVGITDKFSKFMEYLPSSVRYIEHFESDGKAIDLGKVMLPHLIGIEGQSSIQMDQALNLKETYPVMIQTDEAFTFKPRSICVGSNNVEELNKHSELFERVEKIEIGSEKFNFDCLPENIKKIKLEPLYWKEITELPSWEQNVWKFKETEIEIGTSNENSLRMLVDPLKTVKRVMINRKCSWMKNSYSHLKFGFTD